VAGEVARLEWEFDCSDDSMGGFIVMATMVVMVAPSWGTASVSAQARAVMASVGGAVRRSRA
jgi:hypothetical protein